MAPEANTTVTLTAHCLCKANVFTTTVPKSELPLQAITCHCDSCRHVTGALYSVDAHWPEPRRNVDTSKLKVYEFTARIHLLFCGTCSTPLFFKNVQNSESKLGIFTGTLTNEKEQVMEHANAIFLGDTIDGGAMPWLQQTTTHGAPIKRYVEDNDEGEPKLIEGEWPDISSLTGYEAKREDSVPVHCRCRGVDLVLRRGDYAGKTEKELPFCIDEKTHKNRAKFCACDSCRLSGGVDIWPWTYAELKYISFGNSDKAFPTGINDLQALVDAKDPAIGTLTYYDSSPGVQRYFCSKCSACIFYACDERPSIVDISVGIIEASDGARAEGFLAWALGEGRISYREDVKGGWRDGLWETVERNCDDWLQKRGYPKLRK